MDKDLRQNLKDDAKVGSAQFAASVAANLFRDESAGAQSMIARMEPTVKAFGDAARDLRIELGPHLQKQAAGLRALGAEFGAFPEGAARQAKMFGPDLALSSSAGRWDFLHNAHGTLMANQEFADGLWKNSPRFLANQQINPERLALATGSSTPVGFKAEAYNARAFEMNDWMSKYETAHSTSVRSTIFGDMASVVAGQTANVALDRTVFSGVDKSYMSTALDVVGGLGIMATRYGFLAKTASLVGVHVGARLYDVYKGSYDK